MIVVKNGDWLVNFGTPEQSLEIGKYTMDLSALEKYKLKHRKERLSEKPKD